MGDIEQDRRFMEESFYNLIEFLDDKKYEDAGDAILILIQDLKDLLRSIEDELY